MTHQHPTYDQLAALPAYIEQPVPMAFEDINGHLNVRHYIGIASEGLDESLVDCGIPQTWPLTDGHAVFSAEHHCTYISELRTGSQMSARVRLVGRSERAAHALVYLLDDTSKEVSFVMEEIFLHIDLETRKTAPWPSEVAAKLDARIAEHETITLDMPTHGCLALR
ncbi:MAG: thioesterase family protein [Nocardioides sp.]|uniref:thioesterase family protein n=1 Tax=Nocardioides sp. TaxID=35761 RepID=UPI003EFC8CBC